MSPISPEMLARFARLPRNPAETWQGRIVRLPAWVEKGPDGKPYRPWGALLVSLRTGLVNQKIESQPGAHDPALLLEALLEFGLRRELAGCRPGRVEVEDAEQAAQLRQALGDAGVAISVSKDFSALNEILAHLGGYMQGRPLLPDAMRGSGVTVERMRAFAEAAKAFYLAAPWRYLSDEDLIHVEAPAVDAGFRYLTVLGGAGQTFGIGFYRNPAELDALLAGGGPEALMKGQGHWSVLYGPIMDMPFGDAELWEDSNLCVAGDQAYPVAIQMNARGEMRRPDSRQLGGLETLLLALAETSEDEIDRGRWSRRVQTHDGTTEVTLCIPELLEPLDAPPRKHPGGMPDRRAMERTLAEVERFMAQSEFRSLEEANAALQARFVGPMDDLPSTATTPLEKAQDVVYRAFDARGRRRIQLARKALTLSADCADAYAVLAEETTDPERALELYRQAVAAGERALGPETFNEGAGHFWGMTKTRPYMRARLGLANCLEDLGRAEEAIGHYQALLHLNPDDNQGVRDILLPMLLAATRDAEAGALLTQFEGDPTAMWKYGWTLWAFRREGDSPTAQERLRAALKANRHVPKYLTGKTEFPEVLPDSYSLGSVEEAVLCADGLFEAWEETPGALSWLLASARLRKPGPPRRRRR